MSEIRNVILLSFCEKDSENYWTFSMFRNHVTWLHMLEMYKRCRAIQYISYGDYWAWSSRILAQKKSLLLLWMRLYSLVVYIDMLAYCTSKSIISWIKHCFGQIADYENDTGSITYVFYMTYLHRMYGGYMNTIPPLPMLSLNYWLLHRVHRNWLILKQSVDIGAKTGHGLGTAACCVVHEFLWQWFVVLGCIKR